jgi:hypothetical protein
MNHCRISPLYLRPGSGDIFRKAWELNQLFTVRLVLDMNRDGHDRPGQDRPG